MCLDVSPRNRLGRHCLMCRNDMLASETISKEHVLAASLFVNSKSAPQAEMTCVGCNEAVGKAEGDFFNDPFIQQAKAYLRPVSYKRKSVGWIVNYRVAFHGLKPGYQFLFDSTGKVASVFAPHPSEAVWRSVGKSFLIYLATIVGHRAFASEVDPLREFVRFKAGSEDHAGLRIGPNSKDPNWCPYHELAVEILNDGRFVLFLSLFGRYVFEYDSPLPLNPRDPRIRIHVLRVGVLENRFEVQCFGNDGKDIEDLREVDRTPLFVSGRFLRMQT